ncbi:MAG: hypothetical protein Q8L30_01770 [bacterium]|nr:hypothetical protein [bacterium]
MSLIVPAVLPSSRTDLESKLALFYSIQSVSRVQIDIVDGKFASPASWPYSAHVGRTTSYMGGGSELREMIERGEMLPFLDRFTYEIDLMCNNAENMVEAWLALGATRLTFHAESATDLGRSLASARRRYGAGAGFASRLISFGIAINIESDLFLIERCIGEIEYVQFMGIARIGLQGQLFDRRVFEKIRAFHSRYPEIPVQVDGGVSLDSGKKLMALGVSSLVVGSALLRSSDPAATFAAFEALQNSYGV